MNISQPIPSAIESVDFEFLTESEIKSLSVKRIQSSNTFDTLLHPVPGGMYDPAMGAWGDLICTTCHLNSYSCPGHVGHIEMPVPVYHPTFMSQALRMLRAKCMYCHRFKMSRKDVNKYQCKLRLIQHGLLTEAGQIESMEGQVDKKTEKTNSDSEEEDIMDVVIRQRNKFVKKAIKAARDYAWDFKRDKNEAVAEARRLVVKDFMKGITASKRCGNCSGISPTYRKDKYVKIFEKKLSPKDQAKMAQQSLKVVNSVVLLQQGKKGEEDEGIADMFSTEEDSSEEEGQGETLDVDGDVVMDGSGSRTRTASKPEESSQRFMNAQEVKSALQLLFEKEQEILSLVYNSRSALKKTAKISVDMFFLQTLLVPPNRYRPEAKMGDSDVTEAAQNSLYKNIIKHCEMVSGAYQDIINPDKDMSDSNRRARDYNDLQAAWCSLQDAVNSLIDKDRNPVQGAAGKRNEDGIKQKLEKKEGLFRKNMMGKRVNFAARSVISPDPMIETNEIGVPLVFAKKLTYPEPVTSHNFKEMQQAVINGVDKWPGAVAVENENGQVINLRAKTPDERLALANQLLASSSNSSNGARNKKVHRHLTSGDVVLMNRQPTLHKPSIMGHRARVLAGEKTLRMHYANCNTYNADFDGDEMNMHFPQSEIARAEALQIADTDHQYLVSTSGNPLRGLIQDHISVSVWLCNRDTYFDRATYQQLIYNCIRPENGHIVGDRIETVPPAIIKPVARWTGKQVITTILKNITPSSCGPLTLESASQTPADRWGPTSEEGTVLFKKGEFCTGILDKKQIGPAGGGFIHSIHEVYGPTVAGKMLSIMGRLLTKFLHMRAFSCGMDDLRLTPDGEKIRKEQIKAADTVGLDVAAKYVTLADQNPTDSDPELLSRLEDVLRHDTQQAGLDMMMNGAAGHVSSAVTMACLPNQLVKLFPKNQMQNMTVSGAKGSAVNANLISCNLGQQVLEGRRVPVMISGKSLPCFKPFETNIRAGGYISQRFLTGIRPQEYYFHAMAGREGLIDTAVKTSRSGYLQRCLIKGMEGLKVEYDSSVRDADGSMVQFLYGEDGLDVTKQKHLFDFKFLLENFKSELADLRFQEEGYKGIFDGADAIAKQMKKAVKYSKALDPSGPDPVLSTFNPGKHAFATSERFFDAVTAYLKSNPDGLVKDKNNTRRDYVEPIGSKKGIEGVLMAKYLSSVVDPGEAIGIVAGQSVGEPSTQMTLNTFHLAGHSTKNVTLGIPRLREIVMTASNNISTPSMTLRVIEELSEEEGEKFAKSISELSLAEVLDEVTVTESIGQGVGYDNAKIYDVRIKLFPSEEYTETYNISVADVISTLQNKFSVKIQSLARKALGQKKDDKVKKSAAPDIGTTSGRVQDARPDAVREVDEDDDDDDEGGDDATTEKQRAYRKEAVSYGANDEDDDKVQSEMQKMALEPEDLEDEDETLGESPGPVANDDEESGDTRQDQNAAASERESHVMNKCKDISKFRLDEAKGEWCHLTLEYQADVPKVIMLSLVEDALRQSLIQKIDGLKACTYVKNEEIVDYRTGKTLRAPVVHTVGVNLTAMQKYAHIINPNSISTNDIGAMLRTFGVEACRATIVQELSGVFGGHGIKVDQRHLNLIADFMTRGGGFVGFNRMGLRGSVSPFMKMSFETTVGFLADAVAERDWDDLSSPSSRIVIGRLSKVGTGSFDVLTQVPVTDSRAEE